MAKDKSKKKKSTADDEEMLSGGTFTIDFSDEEEGGGGGGGFRVEPGKYPFKITKLKPDTSQAGNNMLVVYLECQAEGKANGKETRSYLTFTPKSLWKTRQLLEAAGLEVPKGSKFKMPVAELLGSTVWGEVDDREPNEKGNVYSEITEFIEPPKSEKKKSKKSKKDKGKKSIDLDEEL